MDKAIKDSYSFAKQLYGISGHVEVEARIKGPIVRHDTVRRLLKTYDMHEGTIYQELRTKTNSGSQSVTYRCIDQGDIVCKSKIQSFKLYNQWLSIVLSVEKDVGSRDMLVEKHFIETTKTRYSKKLYSDTLQLDITHIHDEDIFQVEIEVLEYVDKFQECIHDIIAILLDSPMHIPRKKFDVVCDIVDSYDDTPFCMRRGKYQKPVTMIDKHIRTVLGKNMYMTPKLDGVRRFIIAFNGMIYTMDPEYMHVRLLSNTSPYQDPSPTILDAELCNNVYYIFDICVVEGKYIGNKRLLSRLKHVETWNEYISKSINCCVKEYVKVNGITDIATYYDTCLERFPVDGLVFTNGDHEYVHAVIKWKRHITVDMMVDADGKIDANVGNVDISVDKAGVYELEIMDVRDDVMDLKMIRFRDDKKKPNGQKVIISNMEGFKLRDVWNGLSCKFMRKYHNQVKKDLLRVCRHGQTILDIGTGQGGDLSKWKRAGKVYCVEPNKDAILEFKQRLEETDHCSIKIIPCRVSDVETIQNKVKKVDVMTIFFSINLFTKEDLDGLVRLVSIYKPKHIVGTYMNKTSMKYVNRYPCYNIAPRDNGYHVQLYGTRVDHDEYMFGLDSIKLDGYKLVEHDVLDKGIMSTQEMELSKMFSSFHFRL
jgi:hypothetical protein